MKSLEDLRSAAGGPCSSGWIKFVSSTRLDQNAWRDGVGYDLECLAELPAKEQALVRQWLQARLQRTVVERRDLEAAATLGAHDLLGALRDHPDAETRLHVARLLGQASEVEKELCNLLRRAESKSAISRALDMVAEHPSEDVREALIARVRKIDQAFVPAAMVMLEVFGGVEDAWSERPLLFRVQAQGAAGELMKELLARATRNLVAK